MSCENINVKPIPILTKILFLIPARGGSKGIPNKNIIQLVSKPLIGYTIEACLKISELESVVNPDFSAPTIFINLC